MAIVRSRASHILALTGGGQIIPGEEKNVDTSPPYEQALLADGELILVDNTVAPPGPSTHWPAGGRPYDPGYAGHDWDEFVPLEPGDVSEIDDQVIGVTARVEALATAASPRLDQVAHPTAPVDMNGQRLIGLAEPTQLTDAATKSYVDAIAQGLDVKASVKAATTANITLSGAQTIDGVSVVAGDRVLVRAQTDQTQNGIYVAAAGAWSRSTDADTSGELGTGSFTFIEQGTTLAASGWVMSTPGPITLGTTAIVFTQFSATGNIVAGGGLTKTGATIDVGAGHGIQVNTDSVQVAAASLTDADVATANKDGTTSTPSLRTLGTGALQALAGNTRLDQLGAPTADVSLNSRKIVSLADPTLAQDAATKGYVDALAGGGGAGGKRSVTVVVAPSNSHSTLGADYVLTGVADEVILDTAKAQIVALGGSLVILDGTVTLSRTWTFDVPDSLLYFAGATMRLTTAQANQPVLRLGADTIECINPKLQGSGSRGNGIGLIFQRYIVTTLRLSAALNASATTFNLTSFSGQVASGDEIEVGTEWIKLGTVVDNGDGTATVTGATRGNQGTTAASHTATDAIATLGGVHGCDAYAPRVSNCNAGIEFGIGGGSSSGDNVIHNPDVNACKTGIRSKGFTNTVFGGYIRTCNYGVKVTADRPDSTIVCYGTTILSWSNNAIYVKRGHGSVFDSCWLEQSSSASGSAMTEIVRVGLDGTETPDANDGEVTVTPRQVLNCRFPGRTLMSPGKSATVAEDYLFRLVSSQGLDVHSIELSTNGPKNGGLTNVALVREDALNTGGGNRIRRIIMVPGGVPAGFTGMAATISKAGTGDVLLEELPMPGAAGGQTFGREVSASSKYTYTLGYRGTAYSDGAPGVAPGRVYYALNQQGGIAWWAQDQNYIVAAGTGLPTQQAASVAFKAADSGLQMVVDNLIADHVQFFFPLAKYDFGYGCGIKHHRWSGVSYVGAGIDSTLLQNYIVGTQDIEPLSFEDMDHMYVADMTLSNGGNHPPSTGAANLFDSCDAFDSDHMTVSVIERVRVIASRDRGFVADGKDLGQSGLSNGQTTLNGAVAATDLFLPLVSTTKNFPGFPATNGFQGTMPDQFPFTIGIGYATFNGTQAANSATLNVNSTPDIFPAAGSFTWAGYRIAYTGKTTGGGNVTAFTGCTGGPAGINVGNGQVLIGEYIDVSASDAINFRFNNVVRGRRGSSAQAWATAATLVRVFDARDNVFEDLDVDGTCPTGPYTALTTAPTASGGFMADGTYTYAVAYVYSDYRESTLSPTATAVVAGGGGLGSVALSAIPVGAAGTGVIFRKLYRNTLATPNDFFLVRTIYNNVQTTFTDTRPDTGTSPLGIASITGVGATDAILDNYGGAAGYNSTRPTVQSTIANAGFELLCGTDNEIRNLRARRCGTYGWRLWGGGGGSAGDQPYKAAARNRFIGGSVRANNSGGGRMEGASDANIVLGQHVISNNGNGLTIVSYRQGSTDKTSSKRHLIEGCVITDPLTAAQQVQTNGIKLDATNGDVTDVTIQGNMLLGNAANAISVTGTPTTPAILNNKGYASGSGTYNATPGAVTTITIPHLLSTTPSSVTVTPGNAAAAGAPGMYVTADATNITLNFSAALTAATVYAWGWSARP